VVVVDGFTVTIWLLAPVDQPYEENPAPASSVALWPAQIAPGPEI
jgi:hypothetical protein